MMSNYDLLTNAIYSYSGNTEAISKILSDHPELLSAVPPDPINSPLAWAAIEGDEVLFRFLLDQGMSLTPNDTYAQFVLGQALYDGNFGIAEIIVEKLPDIPVNTEIAAADGVERTYLFSSLLFDVCREGNLEWVEYLLSRGASTRQGPEEYPYYSLATAIERRYIEIVEKLIEAGADVNLIVDGRTMLQRAQFTKNSALIKLLEDAGAN